MRHVDGRLSDRASATWPGAVVVRVDSPGGAETWLLERPGADPVGLGSYFHAAQRALGALIRAEKAKLATDPPET